MSARFALLVMLALFLASIAFAISTGRVRAHMAQSGWTYPTQCCSDQDCSEVPEPELRAGNVWEFRGGRQVPDGDVKPSGDGRWHLCINTSGKLLCAFGPKGGA